jgi:hypothetical protein
LRRAIASPLGVGLAVAAGSDAADPALSMIVA